MSRAEPKSPLSRSTVLRRLPALDLHIEGDQVSIALSGRQVACGRHGLAVLAELSRPRALCEVFEALESRVTGAEDWRDLTTTVVRLFEEGVLTDDSGGPSRALRGARRSDPYGSAPVHISMLNDRVRTESFLAAIRQQVRPGDVVIDLGTGTGVLAVAAARAGARRVYAIEQSRIAGSARALFEANGCGGSITLVEGRSTEIELPERADVLVSEMIGNDPLGEGILSVTADAVNRLLAPGARLIPSRLEVFGLPVEVPAERLAENVFEAAPLDDWRSWYGIDFASLASAGAARPRGFLVDPSEARGWPASSEGIPLVEVELGDVRGTVFRASRQATARRAGDPNGVLSYFEAELAPGIRLSTHPARVGPDNHWRSPVWLLPESLALEAGDRFAVTFTRGVPDTPDAVSVARLPGREPPDGSG